MQYIGIQSQIRRNNFYSVILLIAFPALLLVMAYAFVFFLNKEEPQNTNIYFLNLVPFVVAGVAIWFLVAWLFHTSIIRMATGSRPLKNVLNCLTSLHKASFHKIKKLLIEHLTAG